MAEGRVLAEGTPEAMKTRGGGAGEGEPTMEDAFIHLIEANRDQGAGA